MAMVDPTHTKMLRLQYSRQLTRLYKRFAKNKIPILTRTVIRQREKYGINRKVKFSTIKTMGITQDIDNYLERYINYDIIEPSREIIRRNTRMAYRKGSKNALAKTVRLIDPSAMAGLTSLDWDALILLEEQAFNRVKDCTTVMKQAMTYTCSRGIIEGWGMTKTAYELRRNINGNQNMGITRAKMIARTEVINAYNRGAYNTYKQRLRDNELIWIAALDERSCEICEGYDGKTISNTGEIPPVHPNCRCTISPK